MQKFIIFLDSGTVSFVGIKYRSTVQIIFVHIFCQKKGKFRFFVKTLDVCPYNVLQSHISYSCPIQCYRYFASAPFNADSGAPFPSAQGVIPPTLQHDILIYYLLLLGGQQFVRNAVRLTACILLS